MFVAIRLVRPFYHQGGKRPEHDISQKYNGTNVKANDNDRLLELH